MQIDQLIMAKLLLQAACGRCFVELHRIGRTRSGVFPLKEKQRVANRDLVARSEEALLHGNAIDERAGGRIQVGEQDLFGLPDYPAVNRGHRRVFDTN
jgi:hypothetical protein